MMRQALQDAAASFRARNVDAPGLANPLYQGRLGAAHDDTPETGLHHRQVVQGVAGHDDVGRVDSLDGGQAEQGSPLAYTAR